MPTPSHTPLPAHLAELPDALASCAWCGAPRWGTRGTDQAIPGLGTVYVCCAYCLLRLAGHDHLSARRLASPAPTSQPLRDALAALLGPLLPGLADRLRIGRPRLLRSIPLHGEHGRPDRQPQPGAPGRDSP